MPTLSFDQNPAVFIAGKPPEHSRRTFAGDMLDRGADIVTVANIMGHADVNTTRRYDRRPEDAKRKAADLITVPMPGKMF